MFKLPKGRLTHARAARLKGVAEDLLASPEMSTKELAARHHVSTNQMNQDIHELTRLTGVSFRANPSATVLDIELPDSPSSPIGTTSAESSIVNTTTPASVPRGDSMALPEFASRQGVSLTVVYELAAKNQLPDAVNRIGRQYRISRRTYEALLNAQHGEADAEEGKN